MKVGEERQLIIPADEGYGAGGFPDWGIPPGGTLDFTISVLEIQGTFTTIPGYKTKYNVLVQGSGSRVVTRGNTVTVHATGVVKETGRKFWSTKDAGQRPFTYKAGVNEVIAGWDQGCLGMKVGEERQLIIPADEGYGAGGFPDWGIPPGGTLDFTISVLKFY